MAEPCAPDSLQQAPAAQGTITEAIPQQQDALLPVAPVSQPEGRVIKGRKRSLLEIHESSKDESRDPSFKPARHQPSTTDAQSKTVRRVSKPGATPRTGHPGEADKLSALKLEGIKQYMKNTFDVDYDFSDWTCQISFRHTSDGGTQRQYDPYWYDPLGKKFRSQVEIARHLGYTPRQRPKKEPMKKETVKKDAGEKDATKKKKVTKDATEADVVKKKRLKKEKMQQDGQGVTHCGGEATPQRPPRPVVKKEKEVAKRKAAKKHHYAQMLNGNFEEEPPVPGPSRLPADNGAVRRQGVNKEVLQQYGHDLTWYGRDPSQPGPPRPTVLKVTEVSRTEPPAEPQVERCRQAQLARAACLAVKRTCEAPLKVGFGVTIHKIGIPIATPGFSHSTALYPLEHLASWTDEEKKFTVFFSITRVIPDGQDQGVAHKVTPKFAITAVRGAPQFVHGAPVAESFKTLTDPVEVACSQISPDDACSKFFATQELANMLIEPGTTANGTDWESAAVQSTAQRALDAHAAGLKPEGVTELRLLRLMQEPSLRSMLRDLPTNIMRWPRLLFGLSHIPVLKLLEGFPIVERCSMYKYVQGRGGWEEVKRTLHLEQQIAHAELRRRNRGKEAQRGKRTCSKAPQNPQEPVPQQHRPPSVISALDCAMR